MASRKIFKKKSVFRGCPLKKFNDIDFPQEEPYWNFILRSPGPEKHPSNRAPEGKHEIRHSKKFDIIYKKLHFYDFLKKMHWSPRMAEKWVWESVERPSGGLWPIYFFYKKSNFLFSILIASPGFPWVPWGSPGIPGTLGGPGDP